MASIGIVKTHEAISLELIQFTFDRQLNHGKYLYIWFDCNSTLSYSDK